MKTIYPLIIATVLVFGCRKKEDPPPMSAPKIINGFSFMKTDNPSLTKDYHASFSYDTIFINLPKGTAVSSLIPTVDYKGTSLTPASNVAQDFSQPVLYTVNATDGGRHTYKVSIRYQDTSKVMISFIFKKADNPSLDQDVVGIIIGDSISAITPKTVDVYNLKPTVVYTGTSVYPESGRSYDFRNPVTYTVNAEDSSNRDYRVFTGYRSDLFAVANDYYLYDINALNGDVRWKYNVEGPGGTPVYDNGIVYVAGANNQVYAIDAITGVLKWKSTPPAGNFSLGLPVARYGKIYFGGSGWLTAPGGYHYAGFIYCLNAQTGTTEWLKELFLEYPYSDSRLTHVVVEDNIACVYDNWNGIFAFNAADGTPAWSIPGDMLGHTNPAIVNGKIYFGEEYGFAKLNVANGQEIWRIMTRRVYNSPTISNNTIITASVNTLFAYDDNGVEKWKTAFGQPEEKMYAPLVFDNTVYICNSSKKLLAFNAENGAFKWRLVQFNEYPVIANNSIYITDLNNRINCLDAATGNVKWLTENFATFPNPFCIVDEKGNVKHIGESGGQN